LHPAIRQLTLITLPMPRSQCCQKWENFCCHWIFQQGKSWQKRTEDMHFTFLCHDWQFIHLIQNLLTNENGINGICLSYFLTYKFSQDHTEILFGTIHRRFGWNNNPTALTACCWWPHWPWPGSECCVYRPQESFVNTDVMGNLPSVSSHVDKVCVHIAGFVFRRTLPKLKCTECRELLVGVDCESNTGFLCLRDNGCLIRPSTGVVQTVHTAERHMSSGTKWQASSRHFQTRITTGTFCVVKH